jgi:hypothetical protein
MVIMEQQVLGRSSSLLFILLLIIGCNNYDRKPEVVPKHVFSANLPYLNSATIQIKSNGSIQLYNGKPLNAIIFSLYKNGDTSFKVPFEKGREHGEAINYYENGQIKDKRFYINGWKQGIHKGWYGNGMLAYEYHFTNDEFDGVVKEWSPTGVLFRDMHYLKGYEDGSQVIRYANGKIKSNYVIKQGVRYGLLGTKNCMNVSDSIFRE